MAKQAPSHPDRGSLHAEVQDLVAHVAAGDALHADPRAVMIARRIPTASAAAAAAIFPSIPATAVGVTDAAGGGDGGGGGAASWPIQFGDSHLPRWGPVETSNLRGQRGAAGSGGGGKGGGGDGDEKKARVW